jgi:hypothetical protein
MTPNVIDAGLLRTLMLGLPELAGGRLTELIRSYPATQRPTSY